MNVRPSSRPAYPRRPRARSGEVAEGVLIFLHVPKTAGRTLVRILERQYGSDAVLDLYDSTVGEELRGLGVDEMGGIRAIAGHFYFGLHEELSGPYRYVTFLRDPVERVVSHYHFVRREPEHYLHGPASTMSLAEYVRFCGAAEPNNDQTRLIAGRETAPSEGASAPGMLPAAKRNLDSHAVVGLTEAFDASLVLLRRAFGWSRPFYVSENVDARRPRGDDLDREVRELIRTHNELDVELYRYGRARFEREVREQGEAFARELRTFTALNRLYGGLRTLGSAPRRALGARR